MQTNKRLSLVFTGGFCCVFQSNWYDCNSVFPQIPQPLTEDSCSTPAWVCWRSLPVKSRLFIPSIRRCCSQIAGSFLLNFVCFIYFTIVEVYFFLTSPILLISAGEEETDEAGGFFIKALLPTCIGRSHYMQPQQASSGSEEFSSFPLILLFSQGGGCPPPG